MGYVKRVDKMSKQYTDAEAVAVVGAKAALATPQELVMGLYGAARIMGESDGDAVRSRQHDIAKVYADEIRRRLGDS